MSRLTLAAAMAAVFVPSLLHATDPLCVPRPGHAPCPQASVPCPQPCAKSPCVLSEKLKCFGRLTPRLPLCKPSPCHSVTPASCCKTNCCKQSCCKKECEVVLHFEKAPKAAPLFVPPPRPQVMMVPQTVMVPTVVQSQAWYGYNAYGYGASAYGYAGGGSGVSTEALVKAYRELMAAQESAKKSKSSARDLRAVDAALRSVEEKLAKLARQVEDHEGRIKKLEGR